MASSDNNGGSTDYYKLKRQWKDCADIIEDRGMNYNQGNIFKSAFCFNLGRHGGTTPERELNKIIYFAQRELAVLKRAKELEKSSEVCCDTKTCIGCGEPSKLCLGTQLCPKPRKESNSHGLAQSSGQNKP